MDRAPELPRDPTKKLRQSAIKSIVDSKSAILKSVGVSDLTPKEIAIQARKRLDTELGIQEGPKCRLDGNMEPSQAACAKKRLK